MANLDDRYGPQHRCEGIIHYGSGRLIALAGPGTGKTRSLRQRVRELVFNRGVDPASVAYVTFIREITKKFEEELEEQFAGERSTPRIRISTLHGLALALIRSEGKVIGRLGHLEPLLIDSDKDLLARTLQEDIRSLLAVSGFEIGLRDLRSDLGQAKAQWQQGTHEPEVPKRAQSILGAFHRLSHTYSALDWDQVALWATQICHRLDVLPPWVRRIDHFLVDEYQDFNPCEQTLLEQIMNGAGSVVITGDDDQSLYSWRGAHPAGIVALDRDASLDHVNLVYSWRCPTGILEPATRFLRWMRDDARELQARTSDGEVRAFSFKSAKAEADCLADYLAKLLESIPVDADPEAGVACLFATNPVLGRYKEVLQQRGIPCTVPRMVEVSDQEQWARVLLRLAHLRSQPLLERALLHLFPAIKPRDQRGVVERVLERHCAVSDAVSECVKSGEWSDDAVWAAGHYQALMKSLTSGHPDEISASVHSALGGEVQCSPETVEQFLKDAEAGLEEAVDGVVRRLFDHGLGPHKPSASGAVGLYTMHGAKGLTRAHVILPGCEKLWLPSTARTADPEEQKRLFYVAVTRATESVVITHPRSRARTDPLCRGEIFKRQMSPFVERLGVPIEPL